MLDDERGGEAACLGKRKGLKRMYMQLCGYREIVMDVIDVVAMMWDVLVPVLRGIIFMF